MKKQNYIKKIFDWTRTHKKISIIVLVIIVIISYLSINSIIGSNTTPQYTITTAKIGSIEQTVTGSGQVSSSNQTDIQSRVSGTIKSISVSVGQEVKAGQLLAIIDYSDAEISLQNAKISFAKINQPAKEADIVIAQNNLSKAYDSGYNAVANIFLDLPTIMFGMKDLLYSQDGYLSNQNSSYMSSIGRNYTDSAGMKYDIAYDKYQKTLLEYKSTTRNSATSSLDKLLNDASDTIKLVSEATASAQIAINYLKTFQEDYRQSSAESALANITTWATQANSNVSNIISAQNSILSTANSLNTLIQGTDDLDIQSGRLNLEQSQRNYENYFIRAPYDGIVGRIPVNVYGQAGSGTTIATIIGQQKNASISLNEIDAAKVKVGQFVKITFDAIENINATGTVSVVDQVGTISNGVVSYGIKITINTNDERIKSGMSVNTSITTLKKDNVLIIPSGSIKKSGNETYVQTFSKDVIEKYIPPTSNTARFATSTAIRNRANASSTKISGENNTINIPQISNRIITINTEISPTRSIITTGQSDDTNTEILSGLERGQFVVTKTVSQSSTQTTSAPSILSGVSGARNTGTIRTGIPR